MGAHMQVYCIPTISEWMKKSAAPHSFGAPGAPGYEEVLEE